MIEGLNSFTQITVATSEFSKIKGRNILLTDTKQITDNSYTKRNTGKRNESFNPTDYTDLDIQSIASRMWCNVLPFQSANQESNDRFLLEEEEHSSEISSAH